MTGKPAASLRALWWRVAVAAMLICALIAPLILWRDDIARVFQNRQQVAAAIRAAGAWGPLVVVALVIAQTLVAPIPGQVVNFVAGYLFGFWLGGLSSWVGSVLGSALAMGLARLAGRPLVERLVGPAALARLDRLTRGRGLKFFFLVFLIPGLPDDVACFLAGLTRLPLPALIAAAALGRSPGIITAVWVGATAQGFGWQSWLLLLGLTGSVALIAWRWGERLQARLIELTDKKVRDHGPHH